MGKSDFKPGRPASAPKGRVQGVSQRKAMAMGGKSTKTAQRVEQTKGGFQRKK